MITVDHLFAGYPDHPDITAEMRANAAAFLPRVNALLDAAQGANVALEINPSTGTQISGQTDGGWRPQACATGAPQSAHKQARAVDVYDPHGKLDGWITDDVLIYFGLFREAPEATRGWTHLTDRRPASGHRTFTP